MNWTVEQGIRLVAGVFVVASVALGVWVNPWWLAFTGFVAWLLWLAVHINQLIGFRNKLMVLLEWGWEYFTYERAIRLITHEQVRERDPV